MYLETKNRPWIGSSIIPDRSSPWSIIGTVPDVRIRCAVTGRSHVQKRQIDELPEESNV